MKYLTSALLIFSALLISVLLTISYAEGQALTPEQPTTESMAPATESTAPASDAPVPATTDSQSSPTPSEPDAAAQSADGKPADIKPTEAASDGKKLVARVVWVKGTMNAIAPGGQETRQLKTAENIYMNDTLVTDAKSEAQIIFTDNSTMTFRPDTKLYINEYNYIPKNERKAEEKSAGKYVLDLVTGGFRTITGLVAKENPNDYKVNTPVATIGVRGTEYSLIYKQGQDLYIKRYTGEPCMTNKGAPGSSATQSNAGGGGASAGGGSEVCLDAKQQYGYVANADTSPVAMVAQPAVFRTDVEVIPVQFSTLPTPSPAAPGKTGSSSSFCIQ